MIAVPTVHWNGTSRDELLRQIETAVRAVDAARYALADATPNGRDYYPQGPAAITAALEEHRTRQTRLTDIHDELLAVYAAIEEQGGSR